MAATLKDLGKARFVKVDHLVAARLKDLPGFTDVTFGHGRSLKRAIFAPPAEEQGCSSPPPHAKT